MVIASNSKIYNYYSKTVENNDYISVLYPDEGTGSLDSWSNLFSRNFETQGFKFNVNGEEKVGIKNTVKIYMKPIRKHNVLYMYVLEDTRKPNSLNDSDVFKFLDGITFE